MELNAKFIEMLTSNVDNRTSNYNLAVDDFAKNKILNHASNINQMITLSKQGVRKFALINNVCSSFVYTYDYDNFTYKLLVSDVYDAVCKFLKSQDIRYTSHIKDDKCLVEVMW